VIMGIFTSIVGLIGYFVTAVRRVEDVIPDHTPDSVEQALG
jgi:hypothetical protein